MANQPAPIKYEFTADARKFTTGTKRVQRGLQDVEKQARDTDKALDLNLEVDDSALGTLRRRLLEAKVALENDIRADVDIDPTKALADLRRIERQLKSLDRMEAKPEVKVDIDRGISGLTNLAENVLPQLGIALPRAASALTGLATAGGGLGGVAAGIIGVGAAAAVANAAIGLGGGAFAAGVGKAAYNLLDAYDVMDKGNRKAKIVFGKNLKEVQKWAKGLSTNVGLGEKEIIAASSAIQDLLVPQGFTRAEASDITTAIYERGAALAEFSGLDITTGVEAVTAALLGQRKQLKGLGVDISAKEVTQWIKDNAKEVQGLNEKQAVTVATLALIEQKSGDAWTAFTSGGSAADTLLDQINATVANLKTDAIEGFGGILAGIVADLGSAFGGLEQIDLAAWIKENEEAIRASMLEIIDLALLGADAFLETANSLSYVAEFLVKSVPDVMRFAAAVIDISEKAGALYTLLSAPIGSKQFGEAWSALTSDASARVVELEESADRLETKLQNFDLGGLRSGLGKAGDGVDDLREKIDLLRQGDELRIRLTTVLEEEGKKEVRAELKDLTADQLTALIAVLDPNSKNKSERELRELAEKERKAKIKVIEEGAKAVKQAIADAARDRTATVTIKYKGYEIPRYLARPDLIGRAAPMPRYSTAAAARSMRAAEAAYELTVGVPVGQQAVTYSPTIVNNYPEPERASDSIAMSLRVARYLSGVA